MTNEEKVDILVSNYYINESDSPEGARGVRYGAGMMAKWKDQQFYSEENLAFIVSEYQKWHYEQRHTDNNLQCTFKEWMDNNLKKKEEK